MEALAMSSDALDAATWQGRHVLVTGHTGFKGAWLCLWLAPMGARVTGFALAPEGRPNLFELAGVGGLVQSTIGDLRDASAIGRALQAAQPEVVLHLAAQSLVRRSYAEPVQTFETNVMGTVNLLEAVRQVRSVRAVVVVTSDKCYENRGIERGYVEDDPLGGHDPYSASKGCAEIVAASYRRSFFHGPGIAAIASARAGNVIGGGDWSQDRLLPHEAAVLMLDASAARERLHWTPRLPLARAVGDTIDWHRQLGAGADAASLCLRQVDAYLETPALAVLEGAA
jgi:CDP-glucose 4,6-dehydratase